MQFATPDVFEYLPAWHGTHAVLLLYVPMSHTAHDVDPVVAVNWPAAHAVHYPTPDDEFEYMPAWHGMHAVPLLYVPMLHTTHVDDPAVAANWPVAQAVQFATPDDEFENCPAAHGRQPVPFTLLYKPTLHAVQVDRTVVEAY